MLNFDLYAICTYYTAFSCDINEFFPSFEEAMKTRKNYANWYCSRGDVWIYKYSSGTKNSFPSEKWHIDKDGNIIEHYPQKISKLN